MPEIPFERLLRLVGADYGHTLPDGCVEGTDTYAWERFVRMLNESGWPMMLDSRRVDVPLRLGDLHTASDQRVTLSAWPGNGSIQINIFPGDLDLILFDFATQEITGQGAADALAEFVRATGQATTRSVAVSLEGDFTKVVVTYDPRKDTISLA